MDPNTFDDKVYVVTGAAGGIGLATTAELLKRKAFVYAVDVQDTASAELNKLPQDRLKYLQVDVRERKSCEKVFAAIRADHDRLDGLVNNAGICPLEGEIPSDDIFDDAFAVNVRGVWNMGTEALVQMKKQGTGGGIVNIGSTSCLRGVRRLPAYVATKHAVLGLTRTWALDFAQYNIRVNCVAPGPIDTAMSRAPLQTVMGPRFGGNKSDDELLGLVAQSLPLGRIGQPVEVALQVLFLLSDLASYTTGQIICVSGGGE